MSEPDFLVRADQAGSSDLALSGLLILVRVFTLKVSKEESPIALVWSHENVFAAMIIQIMV